MPEDSPFQDLLGRVRAGDELAALELVRRYEPAIRRAIRIRLVDSRLRRVLDSADVCQSVFGSFFVRTALGQYELQTPQQLLALLTDMGRKKLADQERKEAAARRDARRVETVPDQKLLADPDDSPSRQVALRELVEEFRKRLSPEERRLAERRADGQGWGEIAAEQGGSPEGLRKKLERAVDRVALELGVEV
jgi:RNA polymerase sigma-70 factor (ECF subfamily)